MSTGAIVSDMQAMVRENPHAIFNVRNIADGTGMTTEDVISNVTEWIEKGWAEIHPDTDTELYEFVLTQKGIDTLF